MQLESRIGSGAAALGVGLALLASVATASEPHGTRTERLLTAIVEEQGAAHFDACRAVPKLRLNEVCSVGTECDEDVRVADFVEVINPTGRGASLSCYVIADDEDLPFIPRGELAPGALAAWGEDQLGFRIAKKGDHVTLYRMSAVGGEPHLEPIDRVEITEARALAYRSPDGSSWVSAPASAAEWERMASFNRPNPGVPSP